jgi:hypothetical protein
MSEEYTDGFLLEHYLALSKKLETVETEIEKEIEKRVKPLKDGMQAIKAMLQLRINAQGLKHISVNGATAFKVRNMTVKCTDKPAYLRFCFANPDVGASLLTANVSKEGLSTFLEEHEDQSPPGIETGWIETIQIRRT